MEPFASVEPLSDERFATAEVAKPPRDRRRFQPVVLPNGLRVLLIEDPEADMAAAAVNVHVGHFRDPWHMPGLAHFHEHMLFLGTADFPEEGSYEKYLAEAGGSSNAWTGTEDTNYYFHSSEDAFPGALERFSAFFRNPLLNADATDREMKAVDSEHKNNIPADNWRSFQLLKSLADPSHELAKFGTGHFETLCVRQPGDRPDPDVEARLDPRVVDQCFPERGRDAVQELRDFNRRHYHARSMKLAVVSKRPLAELREHVEKLFGQVPAEAPAEVAADDAGSRGFFPFRDRAARRVDVVPVREMRRVEILYPAPPVSAWRQSHAYRLFSHLLGHEGSSSLHAELRRRGWARGFSAGYALSIADCIAFKVSAELTEQGEAHMDEVVDLMFQWVRASATLDEATFRRVHEEEQRLNQMSFDWAERASPEDVASGIANSLEYYDPASILLRPRVAAFFDAAAVREIQDTLVPSKAILMVTRKGDGDAAETEADTWTNEAWYGTQHRVRSFTSDELEKWAKGSSLGALGLSVDPGENAFLVDDFSIAAEAQPELNAAEKEALARSEEVLAKALGAEVTREDALRAMAPTVFEAGPKHHVWAKTDRSFLVPRAACAMYLLDPSLYSSPRAFLSARIFTRILLDQLTEELYDARLAGLGYSVSATRSGFVFRVSGYAQRITDILQRLLGYASQLLADMAVASEGDGSSASASHADLLRKFEEERESMLRDYRNFGKSSPASLAGYYISQLTMENVFAASEYNNTLLAEKAGGGPELDLAGVAQEVSRFFASPNLALEGAVAGSVDAKKVEEALSTFRAGVERLAPSLAEAVGSGKAGSSRASEFAPPAKNAAHALAVPTKGEAAALADPELAGASSALDPSLVIESVSRNPKESNSAVQVLWQLAPADEAHGADAVATVLTSLAHTSAFQELRTRQQLGYAVSVRYGRVGAAALRMVLSLQSSALPQPAALEERIQGWTELFRQELEDMDEATIATHVQGTIVAVLEKDGRLSQETGRHEGEIASGHYEFHRRWLHVAALRGVTKKKLLALLDSYVGREGSERRCLVSRTYSETAWKARDEGGHTPLLQDLSDIRQFKHGMKVTGTERVPASEV